MSMFRFHDWEERLDFFLYANCVSTKRVNHLECQCCVPEQCTSAPTSELTFLVFSGFTLCPSSCIDNRRCFYSDDLCCWDFIWISVGFLCFTVLSSSNVILTKLHTPTRATLFKPKAGINEILICMNYHDLNDKLNCNFHTFRPVIPFGFLLSLFPQAWGFPAKLYQRLDENQRIQHQKVVDRG